MRRLANMWLCRRVVVRRAGDEPWPHNIGELWPVRLFDLVGGPGETPLEFLLTSVSEGRLIEPVKHTNVAI